MNDDLLKQFERSEQIAEINRLKEKKYKNKNRYVNSLLDSYIKSLERRLDTNIKDEYFHKYELYEALDQIDCMLECEDSEWDHVEDLIERLTTNIEIIESYDELYKYSLNVDEIYSIIYDLNDIQECIKCDDFETALEINNEIIKKYFDDKEDTYRKKVNEEFAKRADREKQYLDLLDSYEYKTKKITKRDIAKILGVTPAAVTQFCKRHGIS